MHLRIFHVLICGALVVTFSCHERSRPGAGDLDTAQRAILDTTDVFPFDPSVEFLGLGLQQFGDLDSMIARRRIRALVPYTRAFYYIDGKERKGIAYEALNLFEKSLNRQLGFNPPRVRIVFLPVNRAEIIPLLRDGYGDLAFAGLTITPERQEIVDFSIPTIEGLKEVVVGGPAAPRLKTLEDLSGHHVFVHTGSSYESAVMRLNDSLLSMGTEPAIIDPLDPYLEVEDVLEMVNAGVIPFTVMAEPAADFWSNELGSLVVYNHIPISQDIADAWAFRKGSPQLRAAANSFLRMNRKGSVTGNVLYNRYLRPGGEVTKTHTAGTQAQLSSLEATFKKYAAQYKLDWLLLAAQGYQESQLDPGKVSKAGAVGIMQVRPQTAASDPINIHNVHDIDNNIHAGAKYMRHLIDHYFSDSQIDSLEQQLFALAAFNAGPSRMQRLRRETASLGLNPNVWFDNVEIVVAREVGHETVQYVSNIYKFYASYRALQNYASRSGKKILN